MVLFAAGVLSFMGAVVLIGHTLGEILWRLGVAIMLTDLALMKIWPASGRS